MGEPRNSVLNQNVYLPSQLNYPQLDQGLKHPKNFDDKISHNIGSSGMVEKYACKSRQGFIPNTKKTNQDAYIIQKDFAGIKGCWFFGVFDGHGLNGHLVSDFCKQMVP